MRNILQQTVSFVLGNMLQLRPGEIFSVEERVPSVDVDVSSECICSQMSISN